MRSEVTQKMQAIHHSSLRERNRRLSGEWYEALQAQKFLHVIEIEKVETSRRSRRSLKNNLDYMGNVYSVLCLT